MALLHIDPFDPGDRLAQRHSGAAARPAVMPMDVWRDGDRFIVEFDLPGVQADSLAVDVDRNVLTVRAERVGHGERELLAAERPRGVFSRQLVLGEALDVDNIEADYHDGVLRVTIPLIETAKPRRIEVTSPRQRRPVNA